MPSSNVSRKVARAAATGASRSSRRGQVPTGWYTLVALIVFLGLASVAYSRYQYLNPNQASSKGAPTTSDHWRVAVAFDICGTIEPNLKAAATSGGITTQGDGIIYINPKDSTETGGNATLGRFVAEYPGLKLTSTEVQYPGQPLKKNGQLCGTQPGFVQVKVWQSELDKTGSVASDPSAVRLAPGQLITIGFVAKGTPLPQPPSKTGLAKAATTATSSPGLPTAPNSSLPSGVPTPTVPSTTKSSTTHQ